MVMDLQNPFAKLDQGSPVALVRNYLDARSKLLVECFEYLLRYAWEALLCSSITDSNRELCRTLASYMGVVSQGIWNLNYSHVIFRSRLLGADEQLVGCVKVGRPRYWQYFLHRFNSSFMTPCISWRTVELIKQFCACFSSYQIRRVVLTSRHSTSMLANLRTLVGCVI